MQCVHIVNRFFGENVWGGGCDISGRLKLTYEFIPPLPFLQLLDPLLPPNIRNRNPGLYTDIDEIKTNVLIE